MPVIGVPASAVVTTNRFHHSTNASDDFTRANSTTSLGTATTGQSWSNALGTWGISSNQAYLATAAASGPNVATITGGSADGFIQFTIDGTVADTMGAVWRYADTSNYWRIDRQNAFGTWNVRKVVAGTNTLVTNTGTSAVVAGTVVRIEYVGSTIWVFCNGALTKTFSDSDLTANTGVGLFGGAGLGTGPRWDDFTAGG